MPKRYGPVLFSLLMSIVVSGTISLVVTLMDVGLTPEFWGAWLSSLALGLAIAFPVSYLADRPLRKVVELITVEDGARH